MKKEIWRCNVWWGCVREDKMGLVEQTNWAQIAKPENENTANPKKLNPTTTRKGNEREEGVVPAPPCISGTPPSSRRVSAVHGAHPLAHHQQHSRHTIAHHSSPPSRHAQPYSRHQQRRSFSVVRLQRRLCRFLSHFAFSSIHQFAVSKPLNTVDAVRQRLGGSNKVTFIISVCDKFHG